MSQWVTGGVALAYLGLLFTIAWQGDRMAAKGSSLLANPVVYALSLAVYCTSWTFFGSVGQASAQGIAFLPIYLGPTLLAALWPVILAKMIRIARSQRLTTVADFISARYGKSRFLGVQVTVIALVGGTPYIALQLKAVSFAFSTLVGAPAGVEPLLYSDTGLAAAILLTTFAILFGARHIDSGDHHAGMVSAIAFESVIKLVAFMTVGMFVTFLCFDGPTDLFGRAAKNPDLRALFTLGDRRDFSDWIALTVLSMLAFFGLPRQFQMAVTENIDDSHINKAVWLFPLYLLLINLFVLPIAIAGRLQFAGTGVDPDTFMLAIPLARAAPSLAIVGFIGGLSAATGMVIVETVALATMVTNYLIMPLLLDYSRVRPLSGSNLAGKILLARRLAIAGSVFSGYVFARLVNDKVSLVGIGLISFTAVAQFAPPMLIGLFWRGGGKRGAQIGLLAGFLVWCYTLLVPALVTSGTALSPFIQSGPLGIAVLKPYALFGLVGLSPVAHALLWSMIANVGSYLVVSLLTSRSAIERVQASLFVDAFATAPGVGAKFWRGGAALADLKALASRFVGHQRAERLFGHFFANRGEDQQTADGGPELVGYTENILAGVIGAAAARIMVASVAKGKAASIDEVMQILDENSHMIAYSMELENKSQELQTLTSELQTTNEKLKELNSIKDEFIATVTHELRTPLTSIRSFSEILLDNPEIDPGRRRDFLAIIVKESERLSRLINQVLDLAKLEDGTVCWNIREIDLGAALEDAAASVRQVFLDQKVDLVVDLPPTETRQPTDRDRLVQVVINLLSNAVKFTPPGTGLVRLKLETNEWGATISVSDNGPGIPVAEQEIIFEKFQQGGNTLTSKPAGTGLGLAISRTIVNGLGGWIWVDSEPGWGATFAFFLPKTP